MARKIVDVTQTPNGYRIEGRVKHTNTPLVCIFLLGLFTVGETNSMWWLTPFIAWIALVIWGRKREDKVETAKEED
jgi:hypothetical protein